MRLFALVMCVAGLFQSLSAQQAPNYWKPVDPASMQLPETAVRKIQPTQCKTFRLDYTQLKTDLQQAPMENTPEAKSHPVLLQLPQADGSMRSFQVWESPVMAPELMAKYPEIRTYAGVATDRSGQTVRLGTGYTGFYAFLFSMEGRVQTVRPYADGTTEYYMSYRLEDLLRDAAAGGDLMRCGVNEDEGAFQAELANLTKVSSRNAAPVNVRKYRLAVTTQGEYSQYFGGTKPLVMDAITQAVNFIVNIQQRDLGIRLELIPNNDTLIYLDPNTDPFMGTLISDWMGQNPGATNPLVGSSSYDIGHVFCRVLNPPGGVYTAGLATLGGACTQLNKARGGSSLPNPIGEVFYLITAHEMGHQFSATHTFNRCDPASDQLEPATAIEPGGGSTIMSYANTCTPDVISNENEPYYHVISIEQVTKFITQDVGSTCGTLLATTNHTPDVSIPLTNGFYIPISTPFVLTGSATDIDGDNLTYCWEEYDLGPNNHVDQPSGTAPVFRSYLPEATGTRTLPKILYVLNNSTYYGEYLPNYSRELNFKLTVRDNHAGGGGVSSAPLKFNVTDQAGPFRVSYPNLFSVVWHPGEHQIVTWEVANTDKAPVNCQKVNIRMSTDAGLTYPITLASNVANEGRYCITVPNVNTTTARVRVDAADNIFFDVSNANFKVQAPTQPDFTFCPAGVFDTICLPSAYSTTISTASILGFNTPINLSVLNLPTGVTANITPNPVLPGSDAVLTLALPANQPEGSFDLKIIADAGGGNTDSLINTISVFYNDFTGLSLKSPADGAGGQDRAPTLRWNAVANANTYQVEVAGSPSFAPGALIASMSGIKADSFRLPTLLEKGTVYYWRFRPVNECGAGDWLGPFAFATLVDVCATLESTDVPKNISANSTVTIESKITVPAGGTVSDVNITKIQGHHDFFKDLEMHLISPAGTDVLLFKDKCPNSTNFNFGFDDSQAGPFNCPPPNNGTLYKPVEALSQFNNQASGGNWILRVKDNQISSGGTITGFSLELCSSTALNPPVLINNKPLVLAPGANKGITNDLLLTQDPNNTPSQLVYTLMTTPKHGQLQLFWTGEMKPGDQFTQADLDNGGLRYFDYGGNSGDSFCFTVTDGEGGLIKDCFTIQLFPVATQEAARKIDFLLAPNPATETVRIAFGEALRSDTRVRLYDAAGRLLLTDVLAAGQTTAVLAIADLPEGLYAVAVENIEGVGVCKLMVH